MYILQVMYSDDYILFRSTESINSMKYVIHMYDKINSITFCFPLPIRSTVGNVLGIDMN